MTKTAKNKRKKALPFKTSNCSPGTRKNKQTCYSHSSLLKLRDYWNARHPDVKITSNKSNEIWKSLKTNMEDVCNTERCWLRQKFVKNNLANKLSHAFAPSAPSSWNKNPNEWLSSVDITKAMKQWERLHSNFQFIGPSPIDFDKQHSNNECVWDELCNFNLKNLLAKGKHKIGIIFNLDPHYKGGSHWVAKYIDAKKNLIFYFDSNGDPTPKEMKQLSDRIIEQGKELGIHFEHKENHPVEHQQENTECGIYTIHMITELLKGNKTYNDFCSKSNIISDDDMEKLRFKYFNLENTN